VLFEGFAARNDLAWLSQYFERLPRLPAIAILSRATDLSPALRRRVSRSDQARPWFEPLKVGPSEAYEFWARCCGQKFLYDYLLGVEATPEERACVRSSIGRVLRYQRKPRFAAKITGPGRIGYLSSIFDDARFVHVIRDGRAVVRSLMNVDFWRGGDRMSGPAWEGGLSRDDITDWERFNRSPLALAAVQWRRVLRSAREEAGRVAPDRYAEVHYERFVAGPSEAMDGLASFCGLPVSREASEFLVRSLAPRDMNFQWREQFTPDEVTMVNDLLGGTLEEFGYGVEPAAAPDGGEVVSRPFQP